MSENTVDIHHFLNHKFDEGTVVVEMEIDIFTGIQDYVKRLEALIDDCVSFRDVHGFRAHEQLYNELLERTTPPSP